MLFRGDIPLTPEEALDYEFGRELQQMLEDGLVMEIVKPSGESGWMPTLRGIREFGSENPLGIAFRELDSSC